MRVKWLSEFCNVPVVSVREILSNSQITFRRPRSSGSFSSRRKDGMGLDKQVFVFGNSAGVDDSAAEEGPRFRLRLRRQPAAQEEEI